MVFVLDTTGSMGGLIEGAKQRIWGIVNEVQQSPARPDVRVGLVAYRDNGDAYVTQVSAAHQRPRQGLHDAHGVQRRRRRRRPRGRAPARSPTACCKAGWSKAYGRHRADSLPRRRRAAARRLRAGARHADDDRRSRHGRDDRQHHPVRRRRQHDANRLADRSRSAARGNTSHRAGRRRRRPSPRPTTRNSPSWARSSARPIWPTAAAQAPRARRYRAEPTRAQAGTEDGRGVGRAQRRAGRPRRTTRRSTATPTSATCSSRSRTARSSSTT